MGYNGGGDIGAEVGSAQDGDEGNDFFSVASALLATSAQADEEAYGEGMVIDLEDGQCMREDDVCSDAQSDEAECVVASQGQGNNGAMEVTPRHDISPQPGVPLTSATDGEGPTKAADYDRSHSTDTGTKPVRQVAILPNSVVEDDDIRSADESVTRQYSRYVRASMASHYAVTGAATALHPVQARLRNHLLAVPTLLSLHFVSCDCVCVPCRHGLASIAQAYARSQPLS